MATRGRYNAPSGGRYFSVGYPGPLQPLSIDWYWQPQAHAAIGSDTRILVEKQRIPRVPATTFETFPNVRDAVPYRRPEDPRERLEGVLQWFWFMFGPLSKQLARGQQDQLLGRCRSSTEPSLSPPFRTTELRPRSLCWLSPKVW